MTNTIQSLRSIGKRVVIIAPPPHSGANLSRCLERLQRKLFSVGTASACDIDFSAYQKKIEHVRAFLSEIEQKVDIEVISFDSFLCKSEKCVTYMDDVILYRDWGHFSHDGAAVIGKKMSLADNIQSVAR